MSRRFSIRVGVIALAAAMLAACGSDDSGGSGGGPGADAGEPQVGGEATIIQNAEPRSLDPAFISNNIAVNTLVGNALYGQLIVVAPGSGDLGEVEYGLAESLETTDGGTTWTLTLRDGLTFSDGTPLDAAAVQFNWERLKDPALAPATAAYSNLVSSMTADGQTLNFTLVRPVAVFWYSIARLPLNWIASPEALQAGQQAFDQNPIGAGPFTLESWQRQGEMVLVRNDSYWDDPRPYLDRLTLVANPDGIQRLSTVTSGGADGATSSAQDIRVQAEDQGLSVTEDESGDLISLTLNTRVAPFDDVRARQAFAQAIDLEAVDAAAFAGEADVPTTVFPSSEDLNGDAELLGYDPEAAQELFDELADEGKPVEFTLTAVSTTENRRTNEAILAQLQQYENISVELEVLDQTAWNTTRGQQTYQVIAGGLSVDPLSLYQTYFSTSRSNASGISDPELDAALVAMTTATDAAARTQAYQDFAATYAELVPSISYSDLDAAFLSNDRLQGATFYSHGAMRADTFWVSE